MGFVQNDISKKFIELAEKLVQDGTVKDFKAIGDEIGLNQSSMSSIRKGKRNIPYDIAKTFQEKYKEVFGTTTQEEFIGITITELAAIKASIKVLTLKSVSLEQKVTKKPYEKVSLELEKTMKEVYDLLLDELRKRS